MTPARTALGVALLGNDRVLVENGFGVFDVALRRCLLQRLLVVNVGVDDVGGRQGDEIDFGALAAASWNRDAISVLDELVTHVAADEA